MKSINFLLFALFAFSTLTIVGCSKDDDKQKEDDKPAEEVITTPSIVGTWVCAAESETLIFTFTKDKKFIETYENKYVKEVYTGTYTFDGSALFLYYDDGDADSYYGVVVTDTTMAFDGLVYTRKK